MATTWGKPSPSIVARAAFLRSRKNAACSSGLSWISWRRLIAICGLLLSRSGDQHGASLRENARSQQPFLLHESVHRPENCLAEATNPQAPCSGQTAIRRVSEVRQDYRPVGSGGGSLGDDRLGLSAQAVAALKGRKRALISAVDQRPPRALRRSSPWDFHHWCRMVMSVPTEKCRTPMSRKYFA